MTTKAMLDEYCIDPRVRLAEYSGGKVATGDGTTTDSEGFSGTSGSSGLTCLLSLVVHLQLYLARS